MKFNNLGDGNSPPEDIGQTLPQGSVILFDMTEKLRNITSKKVTRYVFFKMFLQYVIAFHNIANISSIARDINQGEMRTK